MKVGIFDTPNCQKILLPPRLSVVHDVPIGIRYGYNTRTRYYPVLPSTNEIPIPTPATYVISCSQTHMMGSFSYSSTSNTHNYPMDLPLMMLNTVDYIWKCLSTGIYLIVPGTTHHT